ncbi:signal transducer and activator of transcription C [Tribolium madens]|uniref:signal transducer and activator of transcription C n=1 Tax=Tribolium madens TaxID=41895 RepID=UPI001CF74814|nr:signal transducer and activator of transcription C [Tribolium madens]
MRWAHFCVFVLATTFAKEEEINEVNPPRKLTANLDANLRRALLKALTELENEENEKKQQTLHSLPHIDTSDKIVEKASASALSFFASTESSITEKTTTTEAATAKPIVVIQKSHGLQHKPITTLEKYTSETVNEHEQILTSASSSFTSSSNKFSFAKTEKPNINLVSNDAKATTKFVKPKVEVTTVTTTTEESQAKVEDVQFFSAPLVAAFTVHQDERGLPKSVEPIFRPKIEQKVKPKQETLNPQQDQLRTQLALQEKQKALEAEILRLRQQQQQQNYLIRQQQILHQQQLQLQKQKILDERTRILNNQQSFVPLVTTTQRNEFNTRGSLVSFQPSISFTSHQHPTGVLPLNAQQLPLKNAANFRAPFIPNENLQQFNYLSHQRPPLESSVSQFNFQPTVQPQLSLTVPKHHRVFRQEANTGNFFNSGFNNFNQALPQQNRFFRSNLQSITSPQYNFNRIQPPIVNQQLNHLLYNSGLIRGKQQEDLNIVSKVLALNHYGGDYRFDSSNVSEQRVPPPVIKKV